ncbi:tetratricopeptide repeat protein [Vacuolonema iberomarrocanum]|uniref:tetratricopeptide repeat protein n=1 Tax=Vacuolonema iberomarrocanum TaxID=3454632 RepID=UPI001A00F045|nr:tetratricopeptide repeat protein [filamentous cyanobacterium LEGE 07170]
MRVTEQTHRRLTIQHKPYWPWVFGGIATVIGVVLGAALFGSTTLRCDRTTTQCELTHSNMFGDRQRTFASDSLQGAEVDRTRDSDGDVTYRVVMQTREGEIPLTRAYTSGLGQRRRQADAINAFIQTPTQASLEIQQNSYLIGIIIFIFFGLFGSVMVLFIQSGLFTFDKTLGQLTITRSHIFGRKRQEQYPLKQLVAAQLQHSKEACRVVLMMESGQLIPLMNYYSSGIAPKQKIVNEISTFLGVRDTQPSDAGIQFAPKDYKELLRLAFLGTTTEKQDAMQTAEAILTQDPDDLEAYLKYSVAAVAQGKRDQAEAKMVEARSRFMEQQDLAKANQMNQFMTVMGLKG